LREHDEGKAEVTQEIFLGEFVSVLRWFGTELTFNAQRSTFNAQVIGK